ncbi:MAG TPA: M28 family peptidase [Gemmatimonadaceae bacterium]
MSVIIRFGDAAARRALRVVVGALTIAGCASAVRTAPSSGPASDSAAVVADVNYLASPALAGRLIGTPGNAEAAAYIARRYESLGLQALAAGYRQPFVAHPPMRDGPRPSIPTQNVFALIPGRDAALRGEYIVIGAHFDHLGTSTEDALDPEAHGVRRGADDNASGTAAVLALAAHFARQPARRSIIVANFSGEEQGLLGSAYFVDHMPVPIDSVDAMLNFDMVGRLRNDKLLVFGVATANEWPSIVEAANTQPKLAIAAQGDGFGPSDHSSFYAKNIPVLHFFTDQHEDYHKVSDVPERINAGGEARVIALAERVARDAADRPARLTFVRAAVSQASSARSGSGVYLGSIPDMAGGDVPGLRLTGVTAGSPADVGGLKAGDVIVELGGKAIKDLYSYSDALYAHKPGDEVTIVLVRDGQRLTRRVTLGKRGG